MRNYYQRKDSVILSRGNEEFLPEVKPGDIMIFNGSRFRLEIRGQRRCKDCPFYAPENFGNWQCGLPRNIRNTWCSAYPESSATIFVALDRDLEFANGKGIF